MSRIIVSADLREHEVLSYIVFDGEVCVIVLDREIKQLACRALRSVKFEREEPDAGHVTIQIPDSQVLDLKVVGSLAVATTKPREAADGSES